MNMGNSTRAASYELPLASSARPEAQPARGSSVFLSEALLVRNILWFCRLRWLVIAVLLVFGLLGLSGRMTEHLGLRLPGMWPFATTVTLAVGNAVFLFHLRRTVLSRGKGSAAFNLWCQITLDLTVLTVAVHHIGPTNANVAFAYLFHIVLACIFFPPVHSFLVTAIAAGLYTATAASASLGVGPSEGVFAEGRWQSLATPTGGAFLLEVASTLGIWTVVWYLASHLSNMVREREADLVETNKRLVAAQQERMRHMLTTTHQLKAPFAAVHANAHLLLEGHCGVLPDDALQVTARIASRCRRLASEIQEMLQLANLDSSGQQPLTWVAMDVAEALRWCIAQLQSTAQARKVTFDADISSAPATAVEDHLRMLFMNLLSNAVNYSHPGGRVRVACRAGEDGGAEVAVSDSGIGISSDKLPRIFDEHYRTVEAVAHNKESSGLGLAIVRRVAELHSIRLRVTSAPGAGTAFELKFAPAGAAPGQRHAKETDNGVPGNSGR